MERLIAEFFNYCAQCPNLGGMMIWGALVTIIIWSPYLLPKRIVEASYHLFVYGMLGIFTERFIRLTTAPQPQIPLLEVTAIGLTAVLVWLEAMKKKQKKSERKSLSLQDQYRDWMNAARLALWATLILMPTVNWV
ncbi:MAG: hypothetical protein ACUVTP_06010 [Candidatus Fervidibacter sp.]|uniref:hypothetical protein n=1 Tax=Candidatus Fervidibacter sp. TaxID=3100871 RepID=UPI00404AB3AE